MSRKTIQVTVGAGENSVSLDLIQLPPKLATKGWLRAAKTLGPVLAEVFEGGIEKAMASDFDIGAVVKVFCESATEDDLEWFENAFASCSAYFQPINPGADPVRVPPANGANPWGLKIDTVFAGKLAAQLGWLFESLKLNFSDFLSELVGSATVRSAMAKMAKAQNQPRSTNPSTGSSGE
jgi:hypothetical protein